MRLAGIVLAASMVVVVPASVLAQAPAGTPPPPPAREGKAEFSLIGTTGNSDTQSLGLGGELILRPARWTVREKAAFVRNETEGVLNAQSFAELFRTERTVSARVSMFGQYDYFRDTFAGIENRNAIQGGGAFTLVKVPKHTLVFDGSLGYLNEQRTTNDVASASYGMGAAYKWTISANADLTDDFRYMGVFDNASDWRINQGVALTARITNQLLLKVSNIVRYAHQPPVGFKSTDTVSGASLVVKF